MRTILLLVMLASALEARSKPAEVVATQAKARHKANPVHLLRRLGAAEVSLATRLSSWGIPQHTE